MLKQKDKLLISHLRNNGRKNVTDIAKETNIPVTTIYDRLRAAEKQFLKHTSLVNFNKLGFQVAFILFSVNKNKKDELHDFLMDSPLVNSLSKVDYGSKYQAEVVLKNTDELDLLGDVLNKEFGVTDIQVNYASEECKRESFLTRMEHFGE